jgi:peroxiredoxin Q/BCP
MRRLLTVALWAGALALGAAEPAAAQAAQEGSVFLSVGTMAPDFEVQGATRYGLIAQPIRLSQFRGNTVVLAFYFRVRGGG